MTEETYTKEEVEKIVEKTISRVFIMWSLKDQETGESYIPELIEEMMK